MNLVRSDQKLPIRASLAAFILGVAMSGFFDGILLHQVLQWHHLLSLVPGEALRDPRVQVFADGMFHVLMYVLALTGLVILWRGRAELDIPRATRQWACAFLAGFGVWNVADIVLFHWLLHIHNLRLDVPNPLAWDIGWLVLFGLGPLAVAQLLRRGGRGGGFTHARHAIVGIALVTCAAGLWAARTPPGAMTAVLFRPDLTAAQRWSAIAQVDGRVLATDITGDLMVVSLPDGLASWRLMSKGVLVVGGALGAGCLTPVTTSPV